MFTKFNKNLQILDFMPYKQRVTGSNPVAPTSKDKGFGRLNFEPFFICPIICTPNAFHAFLFDTPDRLDLPLKTESKTRILTHFGRRVIDQSPNFQIQNFPKIF